MPFQEENYPKIPKLLYHLRANPKALKKFFSLLSDKEKYYLCLSKEFKHEKDGNYPSPLHWLADHDDIGPLFEFILDEIKEIKIIPPESKREEKKTPSSKPMKLLDPIAAKQDPQDMTLLARMAYKGRHNQDPRPFKKFLNFISSEVCQAAALTETRNHGQGFQIIARHQASEAFCLFLDRLDIATLKKVMLCGYSNFLNGYYQTGFFSVAECQDSMAFHSLFLRFDKKIWNEIVLEDPLGFHAILEKQDNNTIATFLKIIDEKTCNTIALKEYERGLGNWTSFTAVAEHGNSDIFFAFIEKLTTDTLNEVALKKRGFHTVAQYQNHSTFCEFIKRLDNNILNLIALKDELGETGFHVVERYQSGDAFCVFVERLDKDIFDLAIQYEEKYFPTSTWFHKIAEKKESKTFCNLLKNLSEDTLNKVALRMDKECQTGFFVVARWRNSDECSIFIEKLRESTVTEVAIKKENKHHLTGFHAIARYQNSKNFCMVIQKINRDTLNAVALKTEAEGHWTGFHWAAEYQNKDAFYTFIKELSDNTLNEAALKEDKNHQSGIDIIAKYQSLASFSLLLNSISPFKLKKINFNFESINSNVEMTISEKEAAKKLHSDIVEWIPPYAEKKIDTITQKFMALASRHVAITKKKIIDLDLWIKLLEDVLKLSSVSSNIRDQVLVLLGKAYYYFFNENREALFYTQVLKTFMDIRNFNHLNGSDNTLIGATLTMGAACYNQEKIEFPPSSHLMGLVSINDYFHQVFLQGLRYLKMSIKSISSEEEKKDMGTGLEQKNLEQEEGEAEILLRGYLFPMDQKIEKKISQDELECLFEKKKEELQSRSNILTALHWKPVLNEMAILYRAAKPESYEMRVIEWLSKKKFQFEITSHLDVRIKLLHEMQKIVLNAVNLEPWYSFFSSKYDKLHKALQATQIKCLEEKKKHDLRPSH